VRRLLLWGGVAVIFTAVQIQESLHQGRLALPIVPEFVSYLEDAQWRLLGVYDHGVGRWMADYLQAPPHSPTTSLLAFVGFALLGCYPWAAAAMNGLVVLGLLLFLDHRGRDLPMAWLLPIGVFALTWPLMGHAVVQFAPDFLCGLATAAAALIILGGKWTETPTRHHYLAGFCAGLALLAKPTISPVTIAFLLVALTVGTLTDAQLAGRRPPWMLVRRAWMRCLGTAALMAGPHYVVAGSHIVHYVYDNALGGAADIWRQPGGLSTHLGYYLTGPGGSVMMGRWLYLWAITALFSGLIAWVRRDTTAAWRTTSMAVVGVTAFGLVSIPSMKSPVFGTLLIAMFLGTSAEMLMYVARASRAAVAVRLKPAGMFVVAGLAGAALLAFRFPWAYDAPGGVIPTARQIQVFHQAIERVASIIQNDSRRPLDVFFTGYSDYLNAETLSYYIYRQPGRVTPVINLNDPRRLVNVFVTKYSAALHPETVTYYRYKHGGRGISVTDLHHIDNVEWFATAIRTADYVLAPSPHYDGLVPWLRSTRIQGQVRELIAADPALRRVAVLENDLGQGGFEVFRRNAPFEGIALEAGLDREEGPYPELDLPVVRWGLGARTSFSVILPASGVARLIVEARSLLPEQAMTVGFDDRVLSEHRFGARPGFERFELPLSSSPGSHRVTFTYARSQEPHGQDSRALAVLFRRIEVDNAPTDQPASGVRGGR
jgi:hypothetical protein